MNELKNKAARGVRWGALATASATAIQFGRLFVLSRLLDPRDFGLMAMMLIIIDFANIFGQMGMVEAVIQRPSPTQDELSSLFWFNLALGAAVGLLVAVAAPLAALAFEAGRLGHMLPLMSLAFVIYPLGAQFGALLRKNLHFGLLALTDIAAALTGAAVSILLAWQGLGVLALVWGYLANSVVRAVLMLGSARYLGFMPSTRFRWNELSGYLTFGLERTGAMTINFVNSRLDQFLIGLFLGPTLLGFYNMAFNLVVYPVGLINPILTRVAFPVFAQVQNDLPRLKRGFFSMQSTLMTINAPLLAGAAAVAPTAVPLLLGEKWRPAIVLVQILAFYALIRSNGNANANLILAKGETRLALWWNLAALALSAPVIIACGLTGRAWAVGVGMLFLQLVLYFAFYFFLIRRVVGPCLAQQVGSVSRPLVFALLMAAFTAPLNRAVGQFAPWLVLSGQVAWGAFIYLALNLAFNRARLWADLGLLLGRRRGA